MPKTFVEIAVHHISICYFCQTLPIFEFGLHKVSPSSDLKELNKRQQAWLSPFTVFESGRPLPLFAPPTNNSARSHWRANLQVPTVSHSFRGNRVHVFLETHCISAWKEKGRHLEIVGNFLAHVDILLYFIANKCLKLCIVAVWMLSGLTPFTRELLVELVFLVLQTVNNTLWSNELEMFCVALFWSAFILQSWIQWIHRSLPHMCQHRVVHGWGRVFARAPRQLPSEFVLKLWHKKVSHPCARMPRTQQ